MNLSDIIDLKGDWADKVRGKLAAATYVGIDFGSSTTTVTYLRYDEGTGTLIAEPLKVAQEDEQGVRVYDHLVPTVVAMLPDGHLVYNFTPRSQRNPVPPPVSPCEHLVGGKCKTSAVAVTRDA